MIDQTGLKSLFHYSPETGEFKRIAFINNQGEKYLRESKVTSKHAHGYYMTVIQGKRYRVHHLIFLYMTGELPSSHVDHINGDRVDNRWVNLRLIDRIDNQRNQGLRLDNKVGVIGVYWYPPLKKYQAQITVLGKRIHLGYFPTVIAAKGARKIAEKQYGFHKNHGGRLSWRK